MTDSCISCSQHLDSLTVDLTVDTSKEPVLLYLKPIPLSAVNKVTVKKSGTYPLTFFAHHGAKINGADIYVVGYGKKEGSVVLTYEGAGKWKAS